MNTHKYININLICTHNNTLQMQEITAKYTIPSATITMRELAGS